MTKDASQPGLFARFTRSRGVRKFRRNRLAMASMSLIAMYFLVALWIGAMEALAWAGTTTGAFDLSNNRVLGALLAVRTSERVGPPNLSGFGMKQEPRWRSNQLDFMLTVVDQALRAVDRVGPESGESPRQILDESSMAERRIADLPAEDLRALADQGLARFAEYDNLNRRISAVNRARVGADRARSLESQVERLAARVAEAEDEEAAALLNDRLARTREDLTFALEDIAFAIEDAVKLTEDGGALGAIDPEALLDAADAVREGREGAVNPDLVARVAEAARTARRGLDVEAGAKLDEIDPIVQELFPMPSGLDGFLYRVRISLGTDRQGRSILVRAIYSGKVAVQVGVVAAVVSVLIGTLLGASAAFFGGWVDHAVIWVYSTLSSIPYLVLLALLAFVFQTSDWVLPWDSSVKIANTLVPLYAAFCLTFWIGTCRVIRGETLKLKELEYVQAATAIGFGRFYILLKHVVPNTVHLMFINFSLLLIAAIKSEVVLTFLGLGLKEGASWGIMINQSRPEVVTGFFWQIGAATFFMLVLVLAFNIVSDALQDAFDPKHVG